ncbi:MAG: hypothetical protein L0210_04795 [Rhodospirillales bacterium]|nr:hypothetical protein [Rhodospirillales bacterium]
MKARDDPKKRHVVVLGKIVLLAATVAVPLTAVAAPATCGARKELLAKLVQQFRESPAAVGLSSDGTLVEVLTNEDGSTWTIMVSRPDGVSCLVAAGESWQEMKREARGELGT